MQPGKLYGVNPRGAGVYGGSHAYTGHRCGNCNWQGQGREDCKNNKPKVEQADRQETGDGNEDL